MKFLCDNWYYVSFVGGDPGHYQQKVQLECLRSEIPRYLNLEQISRCCAKVHLY